MIRRIDTINNIGVYKKGGCPCLELSKLVFIYGANTNGKTTFCDILRSLKNNDPSIIEARRRIGIKAQDQCSVRLKLSDNSLVEYSNNYWSLPEVAAKEVRHIEIFDINFVNANIFTNFDIAHKNKEGFTDFILGESAVFLANKLEENLEESKVTKRDLDALEKAYKESTKFSYDEIIALPYETCFCDYDTVCLSCETSIVQLKKRKEDIDSIKQEKGIPRTINLDKSRGEFIADVLLLLAQGFSLDIKKVKKDFQDRVLNINNENYTEDWVRQGMEIMEDAPDACPFCGEFLIHNDTICLYTNYFSNALKDYLQQIETISRKMAKVVFNNENITLALSKSKNQLLINKKYYSGEESVKKIEDLEALFFEVEALCEEDEGELSNLKIKIEESLSIKKEQPEYTIDLYCMSTKINNIELQINDKVIKIEKFIETLNAEFCQYKESLTLESIDKEIVALQKELKAYTIKFIRGNTRDALDSITELREDIDRLRDISHKIKDEMDKEQEAFVNKYFTEVQDVYRKLGGRGYRIEKERPVKGNKKVYGIELYFNEQKVKDTRFVLSESDRRALALAVFFAKVKVDQNSNTTLILDDPITSFDEDRITNFGIIIDGMKSNCYFQVIMFLHYAIYYRSISKTFKGSQLIKIDSRNDNSSFIEVNERDELLKSDYERYIDRIIDFIIGKSNSFSVNDARIFLEHYLRYQFAYEHEKQNLYGSELNEFIVNLGKRELITNEQQAVLLNYKQVLNDESHSIFQSSVENKRSYITEFYEFLLKIK